jgi:hypothetical protein
MVPVCKAAQEAGRNERLVGQGQDRAADGVTLRGNGVRDVALVGLLALFGVPAVLTVAVSLIFGAT